MKSSRSSIYPLEMSTASARIDTISTVFNCGRRFGTGVELFSERFVSI